MPHGWKYVMDTATEGRVYNVARRHYLEKYTLYQRYRPYVETTCRRQFVHSKGRKKRKWLEKRSLPRLSDPITPGSYVLVKNPYPHNWWTYPTTPSDFSETEIVGVVKGFLPPREVWNQRFNRYTQPPLPPGKIYSRERRYRVKPIVGSSKGRILIYDGPLKVVPPEELSAILFMLHIQEMKGLI